MPAYNAASTLLKTYEEVMALNDYVKNQPVKMLIRNGKGCAGSETRFFGGVTRGNKCGRRKEKNDQVR